MLFRHVCRNLKLALTHKSLNCTKCLVQLLVICWSAGRLHPCVSTADLLPYAHNLNFPPIYNLYSLLQLQQTSDSTLLHGQAPWRLREISLMQQQKTNEMYETVSVIAQEHELSCLYNDQLFTNFMQVRIDLFLRICFLSEDYNLKCIKYNMIYPHQSCACRQKTSKVVDKCKKIKCPI